MKIFSALYTTMMFVTQYAFCGREKLCIIRDLVKAFAWCRRNWIQRTFMHLTRRLIENVKVIFKILKSNQLACLKWMAAAVFCGSCFFCVKLTLEICYWLLTQ